MSCFVCEDLTAHPHTPVQGTSCGFLRPVGGHSTGVLWYSVTSVFMKRRIFLISFVCPYGWAYGCGSGLGGQTLGLFLDEVDSAGDWGCPSGVTGGVLTFPG